MKIPKSVFWLVTVALIWVGIQPLPLWRIALAAGIIMGMGLVMSFYLHQLRQPMSFCRTRGKIEYNWRSFLERIQKQAVATCEWDLARNLAVSWSTCACGQQDRRIARNARGEPVDFLLRQHGLHFSNAILLHDFSGALWRLNAIEERARYLLWEDAR